jgi:FdhD protein
VKLVLDATSSADSDMGRAGVPAPSTESGETSGFPRYVGGKWQWSSGILPVEQTLSIFVGGHELVSILCTPENLKCLVLGFLRTEGLISGIDDVQSMRICLAEFVAEVKLCNPVVLPERRTITSGCGGGVTFDLGASVQPIRSSWRVAADQILGAMKSLRGVPDGLAADGERRRGMHVSALSDGWSILVRAEDIGRHNTVDKIWGECMLSEVDTADRLLVTSGRISSEMLLKAAKMGVPVVASLNSATQRAVRLGNDLGITIVGYARGEQLTVYSHPERISGCPVREVAGA